MVIMSQADFSSCLNKGEYYIKGIYAIKINEKFYVGKDTLIHRNKRLKEHLLMLNKNEHYNEYLQNAYNKHNKEYEYYILFKSTDISNEELSEIEVFYIELLDSYHKGYNLTLGGEGGNGLVLSKEERERRSIQFTGENNPKSKLSNEQFYEIVELFREGKTNEDISKLYNIHERYVSLIRHKKRFKRLWENIEYTPDRSRKKHHKQKIMYEDFLKIVNLINEGETNAQIEREFNLSSGMVSRIRHRKIHKEYWKKYDEEFIAEEKSEGATTIESVNTK